MNRAEANKIMETIEGFMREIGPSSISALVNKVTIIHDDGSQLKFNNATVVAKDDWIFVVTEHHGNFYYPMDEIIDCYYITPSNNCISVK